MKISRTQQKAFARAKVFFNKNQFGSALNTLKSSFSLYSPSTPPGALTLAAYCYEKLGDWPQAVETYNLLISASFKEENREVVGQYMKSGTDDLPEAPEKLYLYYHRLAESMLQLYIHDHDQLSEGQLDTLLKRITMYVEILGDSDYEDDSYDTIMERLEKQQKDINDRIFHSSWFMSASYISFRNQLSIQRQSDGFVIPINSTADGICLGGGWRYESAFWEYNVNGCYSASTMNVDTDTHSVITYQQSGVSSTLFMVGPSVLWKPSSGDFSIGVHVPFIYNHGDFTVPAGYTIKNQTLFTYGYFLESNWKLSNWGIFTKFGKASQFNSTLWLVGITLGL